VQNAVKWPVGPLFGVLLFAALGQSIDAARALPAPALPAPQSGSITIGQGKHLPADLRAPSVSITSPAESAQVGGVITITANATDNVGVVSVQFYADGSAVGSKDVAAPYSVDWDTRGVPNGAHALTARARDAASNSTLSLPITVNVANAE